MNRLRGAVLALGLLAVLSSTAPAARAQCSMCRAAVESSAESRRIAGELNRAILVLFAAPYLVVGTCASVLFRRRIGAFLKARLLRRR